jgi:tetratricopeptide (TPR) repeat protein
MRGLILAFFFLGIFTEVKGDQKLLNLLQHDAVFREVLNPAYSPFESNRPVALSEKYWQCPQSKEILDVFLLNLPQVPPLAQVQAYYTRSLHIYWVRILLEEKELWSGPFQPGREIFKNSEEPPTLIQVERFIRSVMVESGTGFFENQFLGIKNLGSQTLTHLDTLVKDHLKGLEFQQLSCRAMGELGNVEAIPLLKSYINNPFIHESIQEEAIYTLAELGDRQILDGILQNYQKILANPRLSPNVKIAYYTRLATMYYRIKEFDKSIESYVHCIQLDPTQSLTYYNLACMYAKLSQPEKAIENLNLSVQYGYEDLDWIQKDGDLVVLHQEPGFVALIQKLKAKKDKEKESRK